MEYPPPSSLSPLSPLCSPHRFDRLSSQIHRHSVFGPSCRALGSFTVTINLCSKGLFRHFIPPLPPFSSWRNFISCSSLHLLSPPFLSSSPSFSASVPRHSISVHTLPTFRSSLSLSLSALIPNLSSGLFSRTDKQRKYRIYVPASSYSLFSRLSPHYKLCYRSLPQTCVPYPF